MLSSIRRNSLTLLGMVLGLVGGFLYWYYVGCASGMCAIKSNPFMMTLYGGLLGSLVGSVAQDFYHKKFNKK